MADIVAEVADLLTSDSEWRSGLRERIFRPMLECHAEAYSEKRSRRVSFAGQASSVKDSYQYLPLPSSRHIRLVQPIGVDREEGIFLATIRTVSIDQCDPYNALSYTWGPATDDNDDGESHQQFSTHYRLFVVDESMYIRSTLAGWSLDYNSPYDLLPEAAISIGRNLSDFFLHLFDSGLSLHDPFWIDAVCINQNDPAEKAIQINLMGDIFSNADAVIAWLGSDQRDFDTLTWMNETVFPKLDTLKNPEASWSDFYAEVCSSVSPLDPVFWDSLGLKPRKKTWRATWNSFQRFIKRNNWFRRCWILQEFCLARSFLFFCSSAILSPDFTAFETLTTWIGALEYPICHSFDLQQTQILFGLRSRILPWVTGPAMTSIQKDHVTESPIHSASEYLDMLLSWTRSRHSSIVEDRVYSILGVLERTFSPSNPFTVLAPYPGRQVVDLFIAAANCLLLKSPYLDCLSLVEPRDQDGSLGLPSWVPDFSKPGPEYQIQAPFPLAASLIQGKIARKPSVRFGTLSVYGRIIGTVRHALTPIEYLAGLAVGADASLQPIRSYNRGFTTFIPLIEATWKHRITSKLTEVEQSCLKMHFQDTEGSSRIRRAFYSTWFHEILELHGIAQKAFEGSVLDTQEQYNLAISYEMALSRSIFETQNGYIGCGPETMRQGDTVWLLEGGRVPYILRQRPDGKGHTLIGECWVLGIMNGELMTEKFHQGFEVVEIL